MTQFITMNTPDQHSGARPPLSHAPSAGANGHAGAGAGRTLLTRRQLLYGAAGLGAIVAAGVGIGAVTAGRGPSGQGGIAGGSGGDVAYLDVPEDAVTALADLQVVEDPGTKVQMVGTFDLPYGTLVWVSDDSVAACLLPTETGSPLTQVALLYLGSGQDVLVLDRAVGSADNFEIYDVRATSEGIVWTEANVLEGTWKVYTATTGGNAAGEPQLLEEGGDSYDTPTIAAVGKRAFWQVVPKNPLEDGLTSRVMAATIGSGAGAEQLLECTRRMGTPLYAGTDSITVAPRLDSPTVYYQLTNIDAASGQVTDQLTLHSAMSPLEAGYGPTGFMFSLPDIYDFQSGIANLGTYTPASKPSGSYDDAPWFNFTRTPSAPPAWCEDLLVVKSTYSVCGVDLAEGTYFAIDVEDGADTYGEYLASTGARDTFVTFTNIDHSPVNDKATKACRVKVWAKGSAPASGTDDETEPAPESTAAPDSATSESTPA